MKYCKTLLFLITLVLVTFFGVYSLQTNAKITYSLGYSEANYDDVTTLLKGNKISIDTSTFSNIGWYRKLMTTPTSYGGDDGLFYKHKNRDLGNVEIWIGIYNTIKNESEGKDQYLVVYLVKMIPTSTDEQGYSQYLYVSSDMSGTGYNDLVTAPLPTDGSTTYATSITASVNSSDETEVSVTSDISREISDLTIENASGLEAINTKFIFNNGKTSLAKSTTTNYGADFISIPYALSGFEISLNFNVKFNDWDKSGAFAGENNEWCYFNSTFDFKYEL